MRLTNLTWPKAQEYFEKNDMVLISIGSIECHGRHMPLGTDTLIPEHLLEKIEKKSDDFDCSDHSIWFLPVFSSISGYN